MDDLIAKRLASLAQIERLITESRELNAKGSSKPTLPKQLARWETPISNANHGSRRLYDDCGAPPPPSALAKRTRRGASMLYWGFLQDSRHQRAVHLLILIVVLNSIAEPILAFLS